MRKIVQLIKVPAEEHKKIQQLELQILEEYDRVYPKLHLPYSFANGSLLGQIMHGI